MLLFFKQVTSSLINGLESDSKTIRLGCCRGLAFLKLNSAVEPLIHLSTDHSQDSQVREEARNCLWTFGHDAQSRYHHCALSTRGFSGIFVQWNFGHSIDHSIYHGIPFQHSCLNIALTMNMTFHFMKYNIQVPNAFQI